MNGTLKSVTILAAIAVGAFVFVDFTGRRFDLEAERIGPHPPPFRVELRAEPSASWANPQAIMLVTAKLEALGYERAGDFVVSEMGLLLRGFCHPDEDVLGVVYEVSREKAVAELMINLRDGTDVSAGNSPDTGFPSPDFSRYQRDDVALESNPDAVTKFHEYLLGYSNAIARVDIEDTAQFKDLFEADWAKEMDWHVTRPSLSEEEVRAIFDRLGVTNMTETLVKIAQRNWRRGMEAYARRDAGN